MSLSRPLSIWRKNLRASMLEIRESIDDADRARWNATIVETVLRSFPMLSSMTLGFYWPYKGEVDARHAVRHLRQRGAVAALPTVVNKGEPLQFLQWWPGASMRTGVFDIPFPHNTRRVTPHALFIAPVAFDEAGYRLGYGGGFYDRTLAAMMPQPLKIALSFEASRVPTIHPQRHDVPMDFIVTERGVYQVEHNGLCLIDDFNQVERRAKGVIADRLIETVQLATGTGP